MLDRYLRNILTARIYDLAEETPLDYAHILSRRLSNGIWLKREDQQPIFSFKIRGAYNKLLQLSAANRNKGVVTASAGNHAQGVALAAQRLDCQSTIVMATTTPQIKVAAVRALGAEVVQQGDNYDAAQRYALELAAQSRRSFIPPYDDPAVIAGQGTIGVEILKQFSGNLDAIFVPIGGGGLISGIGCYIKKINPRIKIIGVEPEDANSMHQSLKAGRRIRLKRVGLFADGVAVKQVGKHTFKLVRQVCDGIVCVSTDEICAAIKDIFEDTRTVMEPAGALALAGVKKYIELHRIRKKNFVVLASGANINFDRLRHVSERAEIGERHETILAVTIPEKPGSFRRFCATIGRRGITEFNYRYADDSQAHIYVGVRIHDRGDLRRIARTLRDAGYRIHDLTDDETAKLHVRHLVGGRAPRACDEVVYRFAFPERPGALSDFLEQLGDRWNISLFHYRNHGADYGRVLAGFQVPGAELNEFRRFLKQLNYRYSDESENPAYRLFLA